MRGGILTKLNRQQVLGFWASWFGWTLDGMDSVIYALVLAPAMRELFMGVIPMKRAVDAQEIAEAAVFLASDSGISVGKQVQLGNLLSSADKSGFPIRVAIISQPNDLGAITALWQKPAAYASFLGTELSLSYAQRLLIIMPAGFGFNWEGHSASAA